MLLALLFVPLVLGAPPIDWKNDIFVQPSNCFEDEPPKPSPTNWVTDNVDDHIEIQNAINTLAVRGVGSLRLMPCVYNLGKRVEMKKNVNVYGSEDEQMVYQTTLDFAGTTNSGDTLVLFNNVSNVEMELVNIRKTALPHSYAVKVKNSKNIALRNMRISTTNTGVRIDNVSTASATCVHVSNAALAMDIRNSLYVNIGCKGCTCEAGSYSGGWVENTFENNAVLFGLSNNHFTNVFKEGYNLGTNNVVLSRQA